MTLPRAARAVIVTAAAAGALTLAISVDALVRHPLQSHGDIGALGLFCALATASWLWPIVMYRNNQSEAIHLDEGFFVIMALLYPAAATVVAFAVASAAAQALRRRPWVKSVFNVGQITTAVGLGMMVARALAPRQAHLTPGALGAVGAGVAVFFLVNNAALAAVLAALGTPWRRSVVDGLDIRVLLVGAGVVVGALIALAVSAYPWAAPLAVVVLLVLRQVLAGHFRARHDRARLRGLFEATVETNRALRADEVTAPLLDSARTLLRCPDAAVTVTPPGPGELGTRLPLPGPASWLTVSGRSPAEPFDTADGNLLEALAAVGAGALNNAALYREVRRQRERLDGITSSLAEGLCAMDRDGRITFLNPAAARLLGWTDVFSAPDFLWAPAQRAMETGGPISNFDTSFPRGDRTMMPVAFTATPLYDGDQVTGAVVSFRDITERKAFEEELSRHAFQDSLTGLANRRLFLDHLDLALRRATRSKERHAVVYADVDRFKIVNDSLGHHAGDQLLAAIADRMRTAIRPGDVLARFGGDEFTLLLEGIADEDDAVAAAQRILATLESPVALDGGHEAVVTLSVGIALTDPDKSRDDLLHDADAAMYQAKANGRCGRIEVFDRAAMGARSAERLDLETALRRALERDELEVFYQPVMSVQDRRTIGAEALVRWRHPGRGLLSPVDFIGVAEESGLILPIGRFVLETACRRVRAWSDCLGMRLTMSVNLSARQFQRPGLCEEVAAVLASTGVDPGQICLEITETMAMHDVERTIGVLHQLKDLGVRLAIDDFGTGYSSLGYLKHFPVDVVKVDRSFVDGLDANPVDSAIVSAVIGLGDTVGVMIVAEGVETSTQLAHLQALGCRVVQGFHLSVPLSGPGMDGWLQAEQRRFEHPAPPVAPAALVADRT